MRRLALACLIFLTAAPAAAADASLGRLFFTPSQRASLDIARSQRTRATVATEQTQEQVLLQPVPHTITYGGMVRRSDGRTTVWLNDRPVDDQKPGDGSAIIRRVRPDGAVTIEVPESSRRVDLKVGQSVEVLSGSVEDGFRRRSTAAADKAADNGNAAKQETGQASSSDETKQRGTGAEERAPTQEAPAKAAGSR